MAFDAGPKTLHEIVCFHRYLLVKPIKWTPDHLDAVGCRFEDVTTSDEEAIRDEHRATNELQNCRQTHERDSRLFAIQWGSPTKADHLSRILIGNKRPFSSRRQCPNFYFSGEAIHRPPDSCVFHTHAESPWRSHEHSTPIVGYIHYQSVIGNRQQAFIAPSGPLRNGIRSGNRLVSDLLQKKLNKIRPKDWSKDQYLVCILLALAQFEARKMESPKTKTHKVRLLVTNITVPDLLHLYEADISAELLEALRNPKDATTYTEWPIIKHKQLQFKPYDTFASRLCTQLRAENWASCPEQGPSIPIQPSNNVTSDRKRQPDHEDGKSSKMTRIS